MNRPDPNESNAIVLWTYIAGLEAQSAGPTPHKTWQEAATEERILRVRLQSENTLLKAQLSEALSVKRKLAGEGDTIG